MQPNNLSENGSAWSLERFASLCALISAILTVIAFIFLFVFYAGVGIFGPLNDLTYAAQMLFTIPVLVYVYRRLEPRWGRLVLGVTIIGLLAMLAVIVLSLLLVLGVIPFVRQVLMLLSAILFVALWFVAAAILGRDDPVVPSGILLAVLAGMSIGYPVWALRLRRNLGGDERQLRLEKEPA